MSHHNEYDTLASSSHQQMTAVVQEAVAAANEEEHVSACGLGMFLGVLFGANALAIWCEFQMTPNESLLQGLATAEFPTSTQEGQDDGDTRASMCRHGTTKLRISFQHS
jgi:hypothetical protein